MEKKMNCLPSGVWHKRKKLFLDILQIQAEDEKQSLQLCLKISQMRKKSYKCALHERNSCEMGQNTDLRTKKKKKKTKQIYHTKITLSVCGNCIMKKKTSFYPTLLTLGSKAPNCAGTDLCILSLTSYQGWINQSFSEKKKKRHTPMQLYGIETNLKTLIKLVLDQITSHLLNWVTIFI